MRFCPWYPLAEAASRAPAAEGVLQVRVEHGLVDYPRGKSAMVHYALSADVRAAAIALAGERAGELLLCRHLEAEGSEALDAAGTFTRLLAEFERRFGARPGASRP